MSGYTLLRESQPVARKTHRCIWCGESIVVGERYRHETSLFDGGFQNHHWHLECNIAAIEYFADGEGPEFEGYCNERPQIDAARAKVGA